MPVGHIAMARDLLATQPKQTIELCKHSLHMHLHVQAISVLVFINLILAQLITVYGFFFVNYIQKVTCKHVLQKLHSSVLCNARGHPSWKNTHVHKSVGNTGNSKGTTH